MDVLIESGARRIRQITMAGLIVITVDQLTKTLATVLAAGHTSGAVVPLVNPEFSLGLAGASVPVTILVCILGIATFGGYVVRAALQGRQPTWVAGLLVGGAVSNLIDRLAGGSVRDFLATPWVVFNIADVAVVVGLCAYLLVRLSSSALTLEEVKT